MVSKHGLLSVHTTSYSWNKKEHARDLEFLVVGCQFVADGICSLKLTGLARKVFFYVRQCKIQGHALFIFR